MKRLEYREGQAKEKGEVVKAEKKKQKADGAPRLRKPKLSDKD
jgi:hypothetical protein